MFLICISPLVWSRVDLKHLASKDANNALWVNPLIGPGQCSIVCYQCCQYLHLLSVLFTVLCYDGSCCRSFGLHVSLATHQVSDVITFCSTFNSVRYGPILYLTIFLNSTIEVLLNHIASIQIFEFCFFQM